MKKFSILVAAYNMENYLLESLASIKEQTFCDFEIILVDKNSSDNTLKLAKDFKNDYPQIEMNIIALEKNVGLFMSRHTAINNSKGEYLVFLDSDDKLMKNALWELNETLNKFNSADMIIYRYKEFNLSEKESPNIFNTNEPIFIDDEKRKKLDYLLATTPHINNIWLKCIKREKALLFTNYEKYSHFLYAEDRVNSMHFLKVCKEIIYNPSILYLYNIRSTSISKKYTFSRIKQFMEHTSLLFDYYLDDSDIKKDKVVNKIITEDLLKSLYIGVTNFDYSKKETFELLEDISNFLCLRKSNVGKIKLVYKPMYKSLLKKKYKKSLLYSKIWNIFRNIRNKVKR